MNPAQDYPTQCPKCQVDLSEYKAISAMPSFCLQCKFPLMLVANKYRLVKVIGQGAVGTVYLGQHIRLQGSADRVIKVIKPELMENPATITRFQREVQITAELSQRNEHIIRIYDDFGEVPHLGYFYIMEYIPGLSLRRYLKTTQEPSPIQWCVELFLQLCDAMNTAHTAGVIHRDLKPDNLMLLKKGANPHFLKVLDWGIAKPMGVFEETDLNLTKGAIGTPLYMSPEQLLNQDIDSRSDIYAMGVILYELLCGVNPFIAVTGKRGQSTDSVLEIMQAQIYKTPHAISKIAPHRAIPPSLEALLMRCLRKSPQERYPTVAELAEDTLRVSAELGINLSHTMDSSRFGSLHGSISFSGSAPSPATPPPKPSQPGQRIGVIILSIALMLTLGLAFGAWLLHKPNNTTPRKNPTNTRTQTAKRQPTPRRRPTPTRIAAVQPPDTQPEIPDTTKVPDLTKDPGAQKAPAPTKARTTPVRRPTKRRTNKPRKRRSPCPSRAWTLLRLSPALSSRAEISLEQGKARRLSSRSICIPPKAGRISILQEGYSLCVFSIPKRKRTLRIKLKEEAGGIVDNDYCVQP